MDEIRESRFRERGGHVLLDSSHPYFLTCGGNFASQRKGEDHTRCQCKTIE